MCVFLDPSMWNFSTSSNQFINYRDSKLTRILQNALGGNSKTVIVATVNPTTIEESHSTFRVSHCRVSQEVGE